MSKRILLPGAGTGVANNLIRSLRDDYPGLVVVGLNDDRFTLRNSKANRNYLVPSSTEGKFADALRTIIERERIDLVIPNTLADVDTIAALRDVLPCRTFMPSKSTIERCANPRELRKSLGAHGIPVIAPAEVRAGRDFACQSLWKDGRLVLIKTVERLAYLGDGVAVGCRVERLAKTVNAPSMAALCAEAIRGLDRDASGAFSVDVREHQQAWAVAAVQAGRFTTMLNFFDLTGRHNMSATYVRLALDEPVEIDDPYDAADDCFFVRGLDAAPAIYRAHQLAEGIEEVA
jgi:hypothetical protein